MTSESDDLQVLYANRFRHEEVQRTELWEVLCSDFFQKWVPEDSTILDVAAGHCEFINNIRAAKKIAIDLNPDVANRAAPDVETQICRSDDIPLPSDSVDRAFVSNFFEHVPREVIVSTLEELSRVVRPGGKVLILQPNVRYCAKDYWMFFDHITPVDDRALVEALRATGFDVDLCIPRFLPYTTKSRLPTGRGLVRLYLKLKPAWRILGAQAFIVATPTPSH